jgi:uncharacterized protein involved in exopolysaccharide biosynthesis
VTPSNIGVPAPQPEPETDMLQSVADALEIVWKNRIRVLVIVFCITLLVAGISLILPMKYVAQGTLLPDAGMFDLISKLGGLQDIAAAAGISSGVVSPSQLYPDILRSESVLRKVIYHKYQAAGYDTLVNLITFFKFHEKTEELNYEKCYERLGTQMLNIDVDKKTLIMTVSLETTDPGVSAAVINEAFYELDYFQRNFRETNASEQRKFLERRLREVKTDLSDAEERLKDFQEKNRTVSQSAQLTLDQGRLQRDVDLNTRLLGDIESQYEDAKLNEVKDTPIVSVLDYARPPAQKSGPKRTFMTLVAFLLSFVFACSWYVAKNIYSAQKESSEGLKRILAVLGEARGLFRRKRRPA